MEIALPDRPVKLLVMILERSLPYTPTPTPPPRNETFWTVASLAEIAIEGDQRSLVGRTMTPPRSLTPAPEIVIAPFSVVALLRLQVWLATEAVTSPV
jgi:hypothetical protein